MKVKKRTQDIKLQQASNIYKFRNVSNTNFIQKYVRKKSETFYFQKIGLTHL